MRHFLLSTFLALPDLRRGPGWLIGEPLPVPARWQFALAAVWLLLSVATRSWADDFDKWLQTDPTP
jgi:hypothetical protein